MWIRNYGANVNFFSMTHARPKTEHRLDHGELIPDTALIYQLMPQPPLGMRLLAV